MSVVPLSFNKETQPCPPKVEEPGSWSEPASIKKRATGRAPTNIATRMARDPPLDPVAASGLEATPGRMAPKSKDTTGPSAIRSRTECGRTDRRSVLLLPKQVVQFFGAELVHK